jgi:two-component system sensor histidine kinase KdpD
VLIELVLSNLLDNAAKYSPPTAPIAVRASTEGGLILMEVADRGTGLTAEEKTKVFEKFYRGPHRRKDGSHGAGLGLAICAAIARLHGGRLDVVDRDGGGARFILSLPVEEQPPAIEGHDVGDGEGGEHP